MCVSVHWQWRNDFKPLILSSLLSFLSPLKDDWRIRERNAKRSEVTGSTCFIWSPSTPQEGKHRERVSAIYFIYHCYCGGAQYCVFIILLFINSTKVSVCLHFLMRLNQVTFKLISECFLQVCPTNSKSRSHHFYEISTILFWKLNLLTLLAYFMYILKFSPHKLLLFLFEFSYPLMTAVYMVCYEGAPVADFLKMI